MNKKTFEITFVVRYEVTEEMLADYGDYDSSPATFAEAIGLDVAASRQDAREAWNIFVIDGDEFTVTGRILEDSDGRIYPDDFWQTWTRRHDKFTKAGILEDSDDQI